MTTKVLSIVVPTYNMDKYLSGCLDSLIVPSLDAIEVLVINDGSTDKSLEIATEYSIKYPNTFRVIDKPNGNYGSCINRALLEANGKYIKILDADDSFDKTAFEKFIHVLEKSTADLIISNYAITGNSNNIIRYVKLVNNNSALTAKFDAILDILINQDFQMHAVTYKRSIFDKFNYTQTEGISYTDQEWMFSPMTYVETIELCPLIVYYYLLGRTGQTLDQSVYIKSLSFINTIIYKNLSFCQSAKNLQPYYTNYLKNRLFLLLTLYYKTIEFRSYTMKNKEELRRLDGFVYSCFPQLYYELDKSYIYFHSIQIPYIRIWRGSFDNKVYKLLFNILRIGYRLFNK